MTRPFPPADYYLKEFQYELENLWQIAEGTRADLEYAYDMDQDLFNEDESVLYDDIGTLLQSIDDVQAVIRRIQKMSKAE